MDQCNIHIHNQRKHNNNNNIANGSTLICAESTSTINITLTETDTLDTINWTIETSPDIGSDSGNGNTTGVIAECNITGLTPGTTYTWYVNASDGCQWTQDFYTFTTSDNITTTDWHPNPNGTTTSLNRGEVSIILTEPDTLDTINWTIETSPNIGSDSGNGNTTGVNVTCNITGLSAGTTYTWYVNASDGCQWTRETYKFTTNNPPTIANPGPANTSTLICTSTNIINITITDTDTVDKINWTIQTSPNVGSDSGNNNDSGVNATCNISGLTAGTTYTWYVNASDGWEWTRNFYSFTTSDNITTQGNVPGNGTTGVSTSTTTQLKQEASNT